MTRLASVFGSSGIAFLDMAANQVLLSQKMAELLAPDFARLGLTLERFSVESVTLPEAIQKALDERISMGVVGDLNRYTQYQAASAIPLAAQNEGGLAGIGAGVGVGAAIGQAMATNMNAAPAAAPQAAGNNDPQARLAQLKALLDQGLITAEDMALVSLVDDTEAVIQVIRDFYADREFAPSAEEEHLLRHL